MIKNIFLPERIRDTYIFSQKYIGLEITKAALIGTKIFVSGKKATIYDFYHEPIVKKEPEENDQSTINAIQKLLQKAGKSCYIRLAVPSHLVIFKEFTFPFIEEDKIRQILPFELGPQIPFSIIDISFDFIVTKQDVEKKQTTILVGITQKKDLDYYIKLLKKAGAPLANITVDIFAFYGLYRIHPTYRHLKEAVAMIDLGFQYTTISYIHRQQLYTVRSINQGISTIAKNIAEKTAKKPSEILEQIIRFGFAKTKNKNYNDTLNHELNKFFEQIQFTFNAFASQISSYEPVKRIILLSRVATIKEFDTNIKKTFAIPAEFFDTNSLLDLPTLTTKSPLNHIPLQNLSSLGAAYPFSSTSFFDLLKFQETERDETLLQKQLITSTVMFILFFGTLIGYSYMQRSGLRKQINKARRTALNQLQQEFDLVENSLAAAVESAQTKLNEAESIWGGVSGTFRYSPLKYLQELSIQIDREGIGLNLKKLIMNKKSINLIGQVRDYKALKIFEEELNESKLFKLVSVPQEPKFEIKLIIKPDGEESI